MAWLHATPKTKGNNDIERKPRIVELFEEDPRRKPPDCKDVEYMCGYFKLSGMSESGINGHTPLSWNEINQFSIASGLNLETWEKRQIRSMSQIYCNTLALNPDASPYVREFTEQEWKDLGDVQLKTMEASEKKHGI